MIIKLIITLLLFCKPAYSFANTVQIRKIRKNSSSSLNSCPKVNQGKLGNRAFSPLHSELRPLASFNQRDYNISFGMKMLSLLGRTIKYFISGFVAFLLLTSQSSLPLYYAFMAVTNSALAKWLKNILKQPRPSNSIKSKDDYGMPSTHTAAITFFLVIIFHASTSTIDNNALRYSTLALATAYSSLACYWRVSSGLHTTQQIFAGALLGSCGGILSVLLEKRGLQFLYGIPRTIHLLTKLSLITLMVPLIFKSEVKSLLGRIKERS